MTRCVLWGNLYEAGYKEVVVVRNPQTIRLFPAESGNAEPETDAQKSLCVVQWPRGAAKKNNKTKQKNPQKNTYMDWPPQELMSHCPMDASMWWPVLVAGGIM